MSPTPWSSDYRWRGSASTTELAGSGGGPTGFTHRVTIDGPLAPLCAAAFGPRMKRNFGPVMRHLADEAETAAAGSRTANR